MYDNQTGSGIGGVFDIELSTLQYLKLISPALRKNDYVKDERVPNAITTLFLQE